MKTLLIMLALATFATAADDPAEKRREIDRMLELTGTAKMAEQVVAQIIESYKVRLPNVPAKHWEAFRKKVETKELIEQLIPLYDKYYSLEDLQAVNAFYASAVGKKLLAVSPQITQESFKIAQAWGQKVGKMAFEEVPKEYQK